MQHNMNTYFTLFPLVHINTNTFLKITSCIHPSYCTSNYHYPIAARPHDILFPDSDLYHHK